MAGWADGWEYKQVDLMGELSNIKSSENDHYSFLGNFNYGGRNIGKDYNTKLFT